MSLQNEMRVTKRNGELETIEFDKILKRIKLAGQEVNLKINYTALVMKVIDQLFDTISTVKIDELSAEQCASMSSIHYDYNTLAGRIIISNHHKNTSDSFSNVMERLYEYRDKHQKHSPLVNQEFYDIVCENKQFFDELCDYSRDYFIDYFGFKTLERAYLMKINGKTAERPQHMWLRVSIGIHGRNIEKVKETYELMSQKYFTHATPTLFNAGTPHQQLSSCYLLAMENDSIDGIYNTLKDCALISKWAGGIGLHIHNVRASGSHIRGTNGFSNGIVPMLRVFNNTAKYVDQGGGKRNGSFAIYLEPWHADIELFLQMRKNHGDEELKARDLFYALWIPDLFMERVKNNGKWTLMCPDECPGLSDVYGDEFVSLYTKYEQDNKGRVTLNARDLWFQIMDAQMETGTPYLLYKDAANKKSNQKNVGTIKSSNLCVAPETKILTDKGHIEIQKLEGKNVNVWNGLEFSEVTVFKTGENQELIEIHTNNGCKLTCTKYHKFYIQDETVDDPSKFKEVRALDLSIGDAIIDWCCPVINGDNDIEEPYLRGYSTIKNNYDFIPNNHTIQTKMEWFSGFYDLCAIEEGVLKISFDDFANDVIKMLQTCGVHAKFDVKWKYDYRIIITSNDISKLLELGFSPKVAIINPQTTNKNDEKQPIIIDRIVHDGYKNETYCFTEPKRNMGVFNGILTGQCTEIIEYSSPDETAVCNLGSIALPSFVDASVEPAVFNYEKLHYISKVLTENLNRIIDVNYYPTEKTHKSNMRHRPIGIGVQGLADVFMLMNIPFTSEEAKIINKNIFETIYHAALERSCEIAEKDGKYETFYGSPASQGILQFDMWNIDPSNLRYDWDSLKEKIKQIGLRNSLLLAPMPTASTSQILGFNECIEPITSNIYSRRTIAGEFIIVNKYLMNDLIKLDLWNEKIKNSIIANNGSIQHIDIIPEEIREKYKTVWELSMRSLIDMAADRGAYICQSQSLNLWQEDPNYNTLTSMHFYSWSRGLKTGIYYLRRRAKHQAQQFTIEPEKKDNNIIEEEDEICEMCSS